MPKDNEKQPLTLIENGYLCAMTQQFTLNTIVKAMDEQCDGTAIAQRAKPILNMRENAE